MSRNTFDRIPFDRLDPLPGEDCTNWIWHGYLARGNITLLTSVWKAGKTTLLASLLQRLGSGGAFLDRPCAPARALVVSEESREHWAERRRRIPIGAHAELLVRPFPTRPSPEDWDELIDHAMQLRADHQLDVFAVDPLASFLPGHSDSDPGTLLRMLHPLQRLAGSGVAVLILHHPRKKPAEEGSTARGSGALLGYVDIILELHRFSRLASDECRRKLIGLSRHAQTPRTLAYQWDPSTAEFTRLGDLDSLRFRENWEEVRQMLERRREPATRRDLLDEWPEEQNKPSGRTLWGWLTRAVENKQVVCLGAGTRMDPFRYRLRNEDDDYRDRGELPPLRPLPFLDALSEEDMEYARQVVAQEQLERRLKQRRREAENAGK